MIYSLIIEANRYAYSKTYRGIRLGTDASSSRRQMSTIIELSPEQTSYENLEFKRRETSTTLTPLVSGK